MMVEALAAVLTVHLIRHITNPHRRPAKRKEFQLVLSIEGLCLSRRGTFMSWRLLAPAYPASSWQFLFLLSLRSKDRLVERPV